MHSALSRGSKKRLSCFVGHYEYQYCQCVFVKMKQEAGAVLGDGSHGHDAPIKSKWYTRYKHRQFTKI